MADLPNVTQMPKIHAALNLAGVETVMHIANVPDALTSEVCKFLHISTYLLP